MRNSMLGMTFWKRTMREGACEPTAVPQAVERRKNRTHKLEWLALAGAAVATTAIVVGAPMIGLAIYGVSILPFVLSSS
jgi:hypothetical protein